MKASLVPIIIAATDDNLSPEASGELVACIIVALILFLIIRFTLERPL